MLNFKRQFSHSLLATVLSFAMLHVNDAKAYTFDALEASFDATYAATPITLTGTVVSNGGLPLSNANVRVIAWGAGAGNANLTARTDVSGKFTLMGLKRRNVLLAVEMPGHYTEIVPVDLHRPLIETTTSTSKITVKKIVAGQARLIFGGDTMMGRRFVDADGDGIEGEAGDLIRPASRAADAKALFTYLRDQLSAADYTLTNLESTITSTPTTPHPYKSITFFSYPETLAGLTWAGIDGVSLGNNHVFDYLSQGIDDTLYYVKEAGLAATGAGTNESNALATTLYPTPNGVPLSMLGLDTIVSDGSMDPNFSLVALDPAKPGALESSVDNLTGFLQKEALNRFAIPIIHGGVEYSSYPPNAMRQHFIKSVQNGAGLVVAHHPHTTQGIALATDAEGASRFVLLSLGNLLFDQQVFETFQSYIAIADVETDQNGGYSIAHLELVPIHHEGFVPKLLAGKALARLGRDIAHLSTTLPLVPNGSFVPDDLRGAVVFPVGHRIFAFRDASQYTTLSKTETLTSPVSTTHSTATREFVRTSPSDSLSYIRTNAAATAEYGRDILKYGNFEDDDVDGDYSEGTSWDQSTARYVQNKIVRSGTGALVLLRTSTNTSETATFSQNRIAFPGGSRLTFRGYVRGDNAGTFKVTTRYYDSNGATISTTDHYTKSAGTYGWTEFSVTVAAPANAKSLRIWFKQLPPKSGEGRVYVDDCAIVLWEGQNANAQAGFSLPTPNNWSYFRFFNVASTVTTLTTTLGHKAYSIP